MAETEVPGIALAYAFTIRFELGEGASFQGEMRHRRLQVVTGGEVSGPRLRGRVVPGSGTDAASDGLIDSHLALQAEDGTWIYMQQQGYELTDDSGEPYFRVSPYFDSPEGPHAWLAKTVLLGTAERLADSSELIIHYHEVL